MISSGASSNVWPSTSHFGFVPGLGLLQRLRDRLQIFSGARTEFLGVGLETHLYQLGLVFDESQVLDIGFFQDLRGVIGIFENPAVGCIPRDERRVCSAAGGS